MKVGFTGTRRGMKTDQFMTFDKLLYAEGKQWTEFHHGDCEGADVEAGEDAYFTLLPRCLVVIHPPADKTHRANSECYHEMRPQKTHFARNRDIVNECDMLIATPWQTERPAPKTGGGTWYTIEYAEKQGKPVSIIWPDGHTTTIPRPGGDVRRDLKARKT